MAKDSRKAVRTQGVAQVLDANHPTEAFAVEDLSVAGLSVRGNPPWSRDDVLAIVVRCNALSVEIEAKVVRRSPDVVGLSITNRSPELERSVFELMLEMVRDGGGLSEQRRAPRLEVDAPAAWSLDEFQRSVKIANLSLTGAELQCAQAPELNTEGVLRLQVPGDTPQCEARVSRHTEGGFAVEFVAPTEAFRMVVSHIRVSYTKPDE